MAARAKSASARRTGAAELLLQTCLVGAVGARHERQHRLVAAAEHERLHDRAHLGPDRGGRLRRRARGVGQHARLDLNALRAQRGLEAVDGAQMRREVGTRSATSASVSGKWQAAMLPPSFTSSSGSSWRQISCAFQQRVWKRQAGGGLVGDGTSPARIWRFLTAASRGSATGTADISAPVYGMPRVRVELVGVRQLDDLAEVHDRHAVAHVAHDRQVVGDEDERQPEVALEVAQQVEDLRLDRDVERGDRLVGDDQLRLERERAGDADALALAARELVRVAVVVLGVEPDACPSAPGPPRLRSPSPVFMLVDRERLADDRADRLARVQRRVRVLEDHLHVAPQLLERLRA